MLRDELLTKLTVLREKMNSLKDKELVTCRAEFDEALAEVKRIDGLESAERLTVSRAERADVQLWDTFGRLMRGEEVDDVGREALAIRDTAISDAAGPTAFRCPGDAIDFMSPRPMVRRSTTTTPDPPLGWVSSDISDMIPGAELAPFVQLPLPPAPLFERATKIGALNGVAIPLLDQTAADPFASVVITKGTSEGEEKGQTDPPKVSKEDITTQEYNAYCIVSDLALRRAPHYEGIIQHVFRTALAYEVNQDILTDILADITVVDVPRAVALEVSWADLVDLEGSIPWYWAVQGEYAIHQDAQTFLKRTLTAAPGYPMYNVTTAAAMYTALNGKSYFLDNLSALGTAGDVIYGDFRNVYVGVGQDIAFRRTNEGRELVTRNSTLFAVFAHMGVGIPIGAAFAILNDVETTTDTST